MDALVGVHVGFAQKLLNEIPLFLIISMFGVLGFIVPSEKP
jgi:F0F1-type ATP synthase assembly protein I